MNQLIRQYEWRQIVASDNLHIIWEICDNKKRSSKAILRRNSFKRR